MFCNAFWLVNFYQFSELIFILAMHSGAYVDLDTAKLTREYRRDYIFPSYKVKYALLRIVVPYFWISKSFRFQNTVTSQSQYWYCNYYECVCVFFFPETQKNTVCLYHSTILHLFLKNKNFKSQYEFLFFEFYFL